MHIDLCTVCSTTHCNTLHVLSPSFFLFQIDLCTVCFSVSWASNFWRATSLLNLQHTATLCTSLQHNAAHCSTLQHTCYSMCHVKWLPSWLLLVMKGSCYTYARVSVLQRVALCCCCMWNDYPADFWEILPDKLCFRRRAGRDSQKSACHSIC